MLRWLTLNGIKDQINMDHDFTLEDELLTGYCNTAEDMVLNYVGLQYEEVIEIYGEVPAVFITVSKMLAAAFYKDREPYSSQNLSPVPCIGPASMLDPYKRLLSPNLKLNNKNRYGCKNL